MAALPLYLWLSAAGLREQTSGRVAMFFGATSTFTCVQALVC